MYAHDPEHFTSRSRPHPKPPPPSSRPSLPASSRNTLHGSTAHSRHVASQTVYDPDGSKARERERRRIEAEGKTDWDVLRENHRFLRDEEKDDQPGARVCEQPRDPYGDEVARRYEASLFREYALIDLKHYKSGRMALRWRTPSEVIASIGSSTCGSLRCAYHQPSFPDDLDAPPMPRLELFELPFAYEEGGQAKQALVKVALCEKCQRKLMWGRGGGKERVEDGRRRIQGKEGDKRRSRSRSPGEGRSRRERRRQSPSGV